MSNLIDPEPLPERLGNAEKAHYWVRHWRGDLSLSRSFWLNTILVNFSLNSINGILTSADLINSILGSAVFIIVFWTVNLGLNVWQYTGVWRAAKLHESVPYAHLARAIIILLLLLSVGGFYRTVFPQMREAVRMVSGDKQIEDYKITILPSGKAIEFYGGFKMGAAKKFKEALDSAPYVTVVYLETMGGRFAEAREMAKIIKEKQLSTYVPNLCASAGVIPFLAGKERTLRRNAKLGFHSSSFAGVKSDEGAELFYSIFRDAGISEAFIIKATKSQEMWYPNAAELLNEGIVKKVTTGDDFGQGTKALSENTIEKFRQSFLDVPMYAALSKAKPTDYERCIQDGYTRIQNGENVMKACEPINLLLRTTVMSRWVTVADEVIIKWNEFNIELLENNMATRPKETLLKFNNSTEAATWTSEDIEQRLPKWPKDKEQELYTAVLTSPVVPATEAMKKSGLESFRGIFARNFSEAEIDLISETPLPKDPLNFTKSCQLNLRFLKLSTTDKNYANIGRFLLSH